MARKRRGRGEGSIYQRADGTWCATFASGYDDQGRRKRRTIFAPTKEEVHKKLREALNKAATFSSAAPTTLKLGAFLDRWLEDTAKAVVRRTTFANYSRVVKNHIKPQLGGVSLGNLSPVHVQGLIAALQAKDKSAETIRLTYAVLRRALRQAVTWRLVPYNACYGVEAPRADKIEITVLDAAQASELLRAAKDDRLEALFVLAVTAGMRLGELFGLQWPDMDLAKATIMVRRTLSELDGELFTSEPKTAKGRRRIDLPKVAVDALWRHKRRMLAEGFAAVEWVFCNSQGGPLRRSHFHANHFKPLLKKAKLPTIRFHDLRHTSATLLLSAGVHPKVVQERLGHSQISVTLDTYSHVLPTMQVEAASRLDEILVTPRRKRKAN
jgi:integrase